MHNFLTVKSYLFAAVAHWVNGIFFSGTELLVWYGQDYARDLGMIRDKNLLLIPKYINGEGNVYTSPLKKVGVYWCTSVHHSVRPSVRPSVTLFRQRSLHNLAC